MGLVTNIKRRLQYEASDNSFSKFDSSIAKGMAILLMLFHHSFLGPQCYKGLTLSFVPLTEGQVIALGQAARICVAIFVFISAYGMTESYRRIDSHFRLTRGQWSSSVIRRILIIESSYLLVFAIVHLLYAISTSGASFAHAYGAGKSSLLFFLIDALGLAELLGTPTILAPFWYISLAYLIVLLVPILIGVYRRWGCVVLLGLGVCLKVFFPATQAGHFACFPDYAFCVCCGIVASNTGVIARFCRRTYAHGAWVNVLVHLGVVACVCILVMCRQRTLKTPLLPIWDGLIALAVIVLAKGLFGRLPGIRNVLVLLGGYATDVFLFHDFFLHADQTKAIVYGSGVWWLAPLVLLAMSLAVAVVLGLAKRVTGYDRLWRWGIAKICARCGSGRP